MNPSPNNPLLVHPAALENRFGLLVAARLSAGAQDLPHDVTERLRAARVQAIARRKRPVSATQVQAAPAVLGNGHTAILGFGDDALGFWGRLYSFSCFSYLCVFVVRFRFTTPRGVYIGGRCGPWHSGVFAAS